MRNVEFPDDMIKDMKCMDGIQIPNDFLATVYYVLYTYDKRKAAIFLKYYTTNATYDELGVEYDVTSERIRQIIADVHRKLRANKDKLQKGMLAYCDEARQNAENIAYERGRSDERRLLRNKLVSTFGDKDLATSEGTVSITSLITEGSDFRKDFNTSESVFNIGISQGFATRLKTNGIKTVQDIIDAGSERILSIRHVGTQAYNKLVHILVNSYGELERDWVVETDSQ